MIPQEQIQRAVQAATDRRARGYFVRVQHGDVRAASLFARLVADDVNPLAVRSGFGWLTKQPSETHVDGFADGAIVYGDDPADRQNVLKIVTQVGSTSAGIGSGVQERRENNLWFPPKQLTAEELNYLLAGAQPGPTPQPTPIIPSYEALGGDEGGKKVTRLMERDYISAGKAGLDGNSGAWQWRTAYDFLAGKFKTVEESIADHQPEWRQALNEERASQGKPPIAW